MPEELFAAMPPILQASIEAGSGPILRPKNASRRLASPPIIAGPSRTTAEAGSKAKLAKAFAETDQHRIRDRLPRQGGAGGAKGHRRALIAAEGENGGDFILVFHRHDDARRQPVETGVGSVSEQAQGIGDDPLRRQDGGEVALQQGVIDFFARHGAAPLKVPG